MLSLVAGEHPQGIDAGGQQVEVVSLAGGLKGDPASSRTTDGAATPWKGQVGEMPAFSKPGVFLVKTSDKEYCVSVRSSEKEGLMQFIRGSQVPALERIAHTVLDYDPADDLQKYQYGHSRTFELFLPFVLLATLALLAEGWLANPIRARLQTRPEPAGGSLPQGRDGNRPDRQVLVGEEVG